MLGDGVDVESASLHNLEWGGVDPNPQGVKKPKPTCLKDNPERVLVPMRCRAYHGLPTKSGSLSLEESKAFQKAKPNLSYHFTISLERKNRYQKTFYSGKFLLLKVCELKGRNTFP